MYGCEVMWGDDRAAKVQALVEESLGMACPCKRGLTCPLLPGEMVLAPPKRYETPLLRTA